jgi:hypothetical protein
LSAFAAADAAPAVLFERVLVNNGASFSPGVLKNGPPGVIPQRGRLVLAFSGRQLTADR